MLSVRAAGRLDAGITWARETATRGGSGLRVLCLDLEGVLVPEIWHGIARATGIDALEKTTRDIPVYEDLMRLRLDAVAHHGVTMGAIRRTIEALEPLPGAGEFLDWARRRFQVAILSDTFYEFAMPLMAKLGSPLLLCHRLIVEDDRIVGYRLRQERPKAAAVRAFQSLGYEVVAVGDSYNDSDRLRTAERACFFRAPGRVADAHPDIPRFETYDELRRAL